ncbi:monoacylglycerol lipase ABHD12 isoform X3 [Zootermopsis nevadensis]|uniref:Monoacylglycerol lipase ABHD12 n=3 Tax=Zootermopsis nevadensis TaxID=136037 RepID=A0A067QHM6_ZOONE|nr:monoacylglycerol lipase ABHD12 isoform X3 [Zootermopsis nevadensis]XP_021939880.1 monoacylglycerol lipase ABHD12 isoform X3 [Zootermopsis nevadensis]KDR08111.1 Monoacylglycerol lipase ABHD12 [Zootermopsis nevadensis]
MLLDFIAELLSISSTMNRVLRGIAILLILFCIPLLLYSLGLILFGTLRAVLCILIVMFGFIPVLFRYTYPLQRTVIFLNFVKWPHIEDLRTPDKYGLSATRNFYITTDEGVTLGMWHILPASLMNDSINANDSFYEEALSHGEPVIVYMHGNSGSRGSPHRLELYTLLRNMNYHVVAFDYRSYGDSSPVSPSEMGVVSDGKYVFSWVQERAKASPLYVWGHSLGTGVSSHALSLLAQEGKKADGLILESPFNNLRDELKEHPFSKLYRQLPWFEFFFVDPVGENQLLFETDRHLGSIKSPVLILHAEDDMVVPFLLGKRLYNTAIQIRPKDAGRVEFVPFDKNYKYGHKYIYKSPDLPQIILRFVMQKKLD